MHDLLILKKVKKNLIYILFLNLHKNLIRIKKKKPNTCSFFI